MLLRSLPPLMFLLFASLALPQLFFMPFAFELKSAQLCLSTGVPDTIGPVGLLGG
jgi:hypothetical protein